MHSLYKYYSADTGINFVLKNNTIKWTTPKELNDPFDNQFKIRMEDITDRVISELTEILKEMDPSLRIGEDKLIEVTMQCIEKAKIGFREFEKGFYEHMSDTVMFCLSKKPDILLMWSHYADKHKGIVIEFSPSEVNSPLYRAEAVKYIDSIPPLRYKDFFNISQKHIAETVNKHTKMYTLSKDKKWEYEEEWRIITRSRTGKPESMILPFLREEVKSVYIGCKMPKENEDTLKDILRIDYPWCKLYKAHMSDNGFEVQFIET